MPSRSTPVSQPPAGSSKPSGLAGKFGGRRGPMLAAGGTVALVALVSLTRKKAPAVAQDATTTTTAGTTGFDSGPYDMWGQWQQQFDQLQGQVSQLQNPPPPGATSPGPPIPVPVSKPPIPTPSPTPKPKPPKPPVHITPVGSSKHTKPPPVVTIQHGQTLSGIAKANHITMAQLKKLNPKFWSNKKYQNGNRIWAGGKVTV